MKIELNDSEIKAAVAVYVATQGVNTEGKEVNVTLRAGRGENGYSAEIEVAASDVTTNTPVAESALDDQKSDVKLDEGLDTDASEDDSLFEN